MNLRWMRSYSQTKSVLSVSRKTRYCKISFETARLDLNNKKSTAIIIQSSAIITWSNLSPYYIRHSNNSGRKWIISESQQTSHISPSRASYGVSIVRILKKIDRIITAPHCIDGLPINIENHRAVIANPLCCLFVVPALESYLTPQLPANVTVKDPALPVLALLRVLHALNRYWSCLYEVWLERELIWCFYRLGA